MRCKRAVSTLLLSATRAAFARARMKVGVITALTAPIAWVGQITGNDCSDPATTMALPLTEQQKWVFKPPQNDNLLAT